MWAFLANLHGVDVDAVPRLPPTIASPADWYTPDQLALKQKRDTLLEETRALFQQWTDLGEEIDRLGTEADAGIRSVLWSEGDDLVDAVAALLDDIGFAVDKIDEQLGPSEPKREDLHVFRDSSSRTGRPVLAEVKGYSAGAKTSDLRQVREQHERFIERTNRAPARSWWIFNDERNIADPSERPASAPTAGEPLTT